MESAPEWLHMQLKYEPSPCNRMDMLPKHLRIFREAFAGSATLSKAWARHSLPVGKPIECFKSGTYLLDMDMGNKIVIDNLERDILAGLISSLRILELCVIRSWGPASRFQPVRSRSSRTRDNPVGLELSPSEIQGNVHARHVARLCQALLRVGGYFGVENPKGSYVFLHPDLAAVGRHSSVFMAHFDQCAYGLALPGSGPNCFA